MLHELIREDSYQVRTRQLGEEHSTQKEEKLQSLEGGNKLSLQEKKKKKVSRAGGVGWTGKREGRERWPRQFTYGLKEDKDDFNP